MNSKERWEEYSRDLDVHFANWQASNPNATAEEKCAWRFLGYDAWYSGYKAAIREQKRREKADIAWARHASSN